MDDSSDENEGRGTFPMRNSIEKSLAYKTLFDNTYDDDESSESFRPHNSTPKMVKSSKTVSDGNQQHQCSKCPKSFKTKGLLVRHKKEHDANRSVCDICQLTFVNDDTLRKHVMFQHTEDGKILYNEWKQKRKERLLKMSNISALSTTKRVANIIKSASTFQSVERQPNKVSRPQQQSLQTTVVREGRQNSLSKGKIQSLQTKVVTAGRQNSLSMGTCHCDICHKVFKCRDNLLTHRRRIHTEEGRERCRQYFAEYAQRKKLKKLSNVVNGHQNSVSKSHPVGSKMSSVVHQRHKSVTKKKSPVVHSSKSEKLADGRFACTTCRHTFNSKEYVLKHWSRVHDEVGREKARLYAIQYWKKKREMRTNSGHLKSRFKSHLTKSKTSVYKHHPVRTVAKSTQVPLTNVMTFKGTSVGKKFQCSICHKKFTTRGYVRKHYLRVHTAEGREKARAYFVQYCQRKKKENPINKSKIRLKSHHILSKNSAVSLRSNTSEKKSTHVEPLKIGKTQAYCDVCHKKFKCKNYLQSHLRRVHTEEGREQRKLYWAQHYLQKKKKKGQANPPKKVTQDDNSQLQLQQTTTGNSSAENHPKSPPKRSSRVSSKEIIEPLKSDMLQCEMCDRKYYTKSDLRKHWMATHTEEGREKRRLYDIQRRNQRHNKNSKLTKARTGNSIRLPAKVTTEEIDEPRHNSSSEIFPHPSKVKFGRLKDTNTHENFPCIEDISINEDFTCTEVDTVDDKYEEDGDLNDCSKKSQNNLPLHTQFNNCNGKVREENKVMKSGIPDSSMVQTKPTTTTPRVVLLKSGSIPLVLK